MRATYQPRRKKDGMFIDQILSGGRMLKDGKLQDIHETSTVQNYDIGTRLVMDERTFRYAKFQAAVLHKSKAMIDGNRVGELGPDGFYDGALPTPTPVKGDILVEVQDTGLAADRPVDYYRNGWAKFFTPGAHSSLAHDMFRRILHSTVGNGVSITVTLDYPLSCPTTEAALIPSNYSRVAVAKSISEGNEVFVGYPGGWPEIGDFGWIQTWGPIIGHYNLAYPGSIGHPGDRDLYFNSSGEIITPKQSGNDVYVSYQRAGYLLATGGGSTFFMLQLAP